MAGVKRPQIATAFLLERCMGWRADVPRAAGRPSAGRGGCVSRVLLFQFDMLDVPDFTAEEPGAKVAELLN